MNKLFIYFFIHLKVESGSMTGDSVNPNRAPSVHDSGLNRFPTHTPRTASIVASRAASMSSAVIAR